MPNQNIVIDEFKYFSEKFDSKYLRIDWFSRITISTTNETEKMVVVRVSPVDKVVNAKSKKEFFKLNQIKAKKISPKKENELFIGVGQLSVISLGQIWHNGSLLDYQAGSYKKFSFDTNLHSESNLVNVWKIQSSKLFISNDDRKGFCLSFGAEDDYGTAVTVILPILELVRFYFCLSSQLSRAVFDGTLLNDINQFINLELSGFDDLQNPVIHRRRNVSNDEAIIIARILSDVAALKSINDLFTSMMVSRANDDSVIYPKSFFPFNGKTKLSVLCREISDDDHELSFVILKIQMCEAKMPFSKLIIGADNDNTSPENQEDDNIRTPAFHGSVVYDFGVDDVLLQSSKSSDGNISEHRIDQISNRFSFLKQVVIKRKTKLTCEYKKSDIKVYRDVPNDGAAGTSQKRYESTEVIPTSIDNKHDFEEKDRIENIPTSFYGFKKAIETLNSLQKFHTYLRPGTGQVNGLWKAIVDRPRSTHWSYNKSYRNVPKHITRDLRHFMVANINYEGRYYILIDIEPREGQKNGFRMELLNEQDFNEISDMRIESLIRELCKHKGQFSKIRNQLGFLRIGEGIFHRWQTVDGMVERIKERFY